MTQKELLYYEDAISHEQNIIKILNDTQSRLENDDLVSFIENELSIHKVSLEKLLNMLKEKVNG